MIKIHQYTDLQEGPNSFVFYHGQSMKVKSLLLLIYLCFTTVAANSEESTKYYPPIHTPDEVLQLAERHLTKEDINIDKYKLVSLSYSYLVREWTLLFSYNNGKLNKYFNILINDEYLCDYKIEGLSKNQSIH